MIKNPMLEVLKKELKESYSIAQKCADYLQAKGQVHLVDDEVGYMAIHINRISQQLKV
jgi:transcriptional antiterminator